MTESSACDALDRQWMEAALQLAQQAAAENETPIGAVIVHNGRVISQGYNQRENHQDVTLHAEMTAIREACAVLNSWRLDDCDLYVTLEPCVMCAGAIIQARLRRLVFAAADPKAGAAGSMTDVFSLPHNHQVQVTQGIMASESSTLIRAFFRRLRQENRAAGSRAVRREQAKEVRPMRPDHSDENESSRIRS